MKKLTVLQLCKDALNDPGLCDVDAMRDYVVYHHDGPIEAGVVVDTLQWLGGDKIIAKASQLVAEPDAATRAILEEADYQEQQTRQFWTLDATVCRAKAEVREHIKQGLLPPTVASFEELYDYVDANWYGGAFRRDVPREEMPGLGFWNQVQEKIDDWLVDGWVTDARDVLLATMLLLSDQDRWIKGWYAVDDVLIDVGPGDANACRWCLSGAVEKFCTGKPQLAQAHEQVKKILTIVIKTLFVPEADLKLQNNRLVCFNDARQTTHEDLMKVLEVAVTYKSLCQRL